MTPSASPSIDSRASRPTMGSAPSGIRDTDPKSTMPSRPSLRSRKLPGCGSVCSARARSGAEKWNSAMMRPQVSRCSRVPSAMIFAIPMPSTHSVMISCGALATTLPMAISGSSA